jgi:hypothetical protein
MTKLGYITNFNDNEKTLLNDAWSILLPDNEEDSKLEQRIS